VAFSLVALGGATGAVALAMNHVQASCWRDRQEAELPSPARQAGAMRLKLYRNRPSCRAGERVQVSGAPILVAGLVGMTNVIARRLSVVPSCVDDRRRIKLRGVADSWAMLFDPQRT
jgi:hypothetical protein